MLGLERSLGSRIVTHVDDLVILCRRGKGEEALARMRELMGKLKLTVTRCHSLGGRNRRAARAGDRQRVLNQTRQSATVPTRCYRHR
jgi:hypothetical protein